MMTPEETLMLLKQLHKDIDTLSGLILDSLVNEEETKEAA